MVGSRLVGSAFFGYGIDLPRQKIEYDCHDPFNKPYESTRSLEASLEVLVDAKAYVYGLGKQLEEKSFRGHPRQVEKQSKVCHLMLIAGENAVNFVNSGFNMAKSWRRVGNLIPRLSGVFRETLS